MVTPAGDRSRLIFFDRLAVTKDSYGQEIGGTATTIAAAWAKILFGTGQERREAAQERATIAATFICRWTPVLGGVLDTDSIRFQGVWDITSRALVGLNEEIHFTAVRNGTDFDEGGSQ